MKPRLAGAFMLLALLTSACNSSMKTLDIKRNPNPKMRYEITLAVHDAPGPFESVSGYMQHQVLDKACVPEIPFEGAKVMPDHPVDFAFTRINDQEYVGTVYLDLLQDDDYYGLGECHWTMTLAGVVLKTQSASFVSSIPLSSIVARTPNSAYLPKKAYFAKASEPAVMSISGMPFGTPVAEYAAKHPEEFFVVTLTSSEIRQ